MRALIADDEAPLRAWLRRLLAEAAPAVEVVAEVADGTTALAEIERLQPDVAFLDIRMPGLTGLEVAARLVASTGSPVEFAPGNGSKSGSKSGSEDRSESGAGSWAESGSGRGSERGSGAKRDVGVAPRPGAGCRVVFVTAYDEFALQAFEHAAVDYLLKPVTIDRLKKTLQRLQSPPPPQAEQVMRELLATLRAAAPGSPRETLRWLRVGVGDAIQMIDVGSVDSFEATDKYTTVHCAGHDYLVRTALKDLEDGLDPERFWRIHRGTIVRVDAIAQVRRDLMGRLWVDLKGSGKPLAVSRSFAYLFRQM